MSYELPKLENWKETINTIQKIGHLLKEFQKSGSEPKPLSLEHSVRIYPKGMFSEIKEKGNLFYNYAQERISFKTENELLFKISTENKSIDTITSDLQNEFKKQNLTLFPNTKKISNQDSLKVNNKIAKETANAYWKLYSALSRVKAEIFGHCSPIVLWTHQFDFSFIYFPTEKLTEQDPTIALGFAPFSDDIHRPYAYMYAWNGKSYVELDQNKLPEKVTWWDKGWKGTVFLYDDMLTYQDPIKRLEDHFRQAFKLFKSSI